MPIPLPDHPNLARLEVQAAQLEGAANAGESAARARISEAVPEADATAATAADARLTLAREHGFHNWHALAVEVGRRMVDEGDLQRWFGVQLNNAAWDVIDGGDVAVMSEEEAERLLYSAYASTYHWMQVGTVANRARGEHLISRTALHVGRHDLALHHADRCLTLVETHPGEVEDWDLAFALEALARARAAAGDPAAPSTLERALQVAAEVRDPADRAIVESQLASGPWFGLRPD